MSTRREFLKVTAAGAAAVALSQKVGACSPELPAGPVRVRFTHADKRFAEAAAINWRTLAQAGANSIRLNPDEKLQEVLGFGAAFTDSACYMFNQLPPGARQELLHEFFDPSQMAFSVCRTCIGASDYSKSLYSFCDSDQPDTELTRFTIEHDRAYILPALRDARKVNPDLFLFSSPWSPPGWMKANNSMLGGSMRKKYYAPYAQYFLKFLNAYAADGVKINAITVQNETDTDQDGRMPACLWGQEYEIEFVKGHLGPVLQKAGLDTKIWIVDHNYNLWGRAICELSDPDAYKFIEGVAWHGYAGDPTAMTKVHDAYPQKSAYWTEGGPDVTAPDYLTDWAKWAGTFTEILRNWARCITGWNLALDEKGNPNIGPFPCGGVVTIHSQTGEITRSGQYWAFAHFSRLMKRGARVFRTEGNINDVSHVAVQNPDGGRVLVLTNRGKQQQKVEIALGSQALDLDLPADSVYTLSW